MKRWYLVLIVALAAALFLQAGLIAFAIYALLGILFLSRVMAHGWVAQLSASRDARVDGPAEIGDTVEVKIQIRNKGPLPVAWVLVEDMLPESALIRPPRLKVQGRRVRMAMMRPGARLTMKYSLECLMRGYYQLGPTLLETGDLFGLHRRHRVVTDPAFLMVLPKVVSLPKYDFASQRPIGEIHMANRLFEDPTRNAGVRPYQVGDPLQRVHWRATARAGTLMSKVYDPTSLTGATLLLDFNNEGYHKRGEPYRSELAVTTAVSIAYVVAMLNQQVGFACNGRDAADRARLDVHSQQGSDDDAPGYETRAEARVESEMLDSSNRLRPVHVETRRGIEQFQRIREALARVELSDGMSFPRFVLEMIPRMPRDATVIAILPQVEVETSVVLGNLRRQGFAVTALLIGFTEDDLARGTGRLITEGVRDVRHIANEAGLSLMGHQEASPGPVPYSVSMDLA